MVASKGILTCNALSDPQFAGRFQYPSFVSVADEEAVVVRHSVLRTEAPLSVGRQQLGDDVQSRLSSFSPLQSESDCQIGYMGVGSFNERERERERAIT